MEMEISSHILEKISNTKSNEILYNLSRGVT